MGLTYLPVMAVVGCFPLFRCTTTTVCIGDLVPCTWTCVWPIIGPQGFQIVVNLKWKNVMQNMETIKYMSIKQYIWELNKSIQHLSSKYSMETKAAKGRGNVSPIIYTSTRSKRHRWHLIKDSLLLTLGGQICPISHAEAYSRYSLLVSLLHKILVSILR